MLFHGMMLACSSTGCHEDRCMLIIAFFYDAHAHQSYTSHASHSELLAMQVLVLLCNDVSFLRFVVPPAVIA
jgi:hypothetical protein